MRALRVVQSLSKYSASETTDLANDASLVASYIQGDITEVGICQCDAHCIEIYCWSTSIRREDKSFNLCGHISPVISLINEKNL